MKFAEFFPGQVIEAGPVGILRWRWQPHDQHGTEVLDIEATSPFDLPPIGDPSP